MGALVGRWAANAARNKGGWQLAAASDWSPAVRGTGRQWEKDKVQVLARGHSVWHHCTALHCTALQLLGTYLATTTPENLEAFQGSVITTYSHSTLQSAQRHLFLTRLHPSTRPFVWAYVLASPLVYSFITRTLQRTVASLSRQSFWGLLLTFVT